MLIYVDQSTGTWGEADNLIIVDTDNNKLLKEEAYYATDESKVADEVIDYLVDASDKQIMHFAHRYGKFLLSVFGTKFRDGYKAGISDAIDSVAMGG